MTSLSRGHLSPTCYNSVSYPCSSKRRYGSHASGFLACCPHYPGKSEQSSLGLLKLHSRCSLPGCCSPHGLHFAHELQREDCPVQLSGQLKGMNRQFPGWDLHPLVTCASVAHHRSVVPIMLYFVNVLPLILVGTYVWIIILEPEHEEIYYKGFFKIVELHTSYIDLKFQFFQFISSFTH